MAAPKIIDFEVAKALSEKLTADTMFTRVGVLVGTPEYMSPEQVGLRVRTSTPVPVSNRSVSFSMSCWQVLRQ
jgi:serine/threonine protein kinase